MAVRNKKTDDQPDPRIPAANKIKNHSTDNEPAWNAQNLIGQQYGNLRLLSLLGIGKLGPVFLAEDTTTQGRLAVKLLRPEFNETPEKIQGYFRAAQQSSNLDTPHILPVQECHFEQSGPNYVVMEALNGFLIRDAIETRMPVSLLELVDIGLQLANALATAHAHGTTHQCLSDSNVFLVRRRNHPYCVKILDFGISELLLEPEPNDSTKYMRDIQSFGKIFSEWTQAVSLPNSPLVEELKSIFQECIEILPNQPNEFMKWVCQGLTRIKENDQTTSGLSLSNPESALALNDDIEWNPSWQNSRFAKIGLSVAAASFLVLFGAFQLPFEANADRTPATAEEAKLSLQEHNVVKGRQTTANNDSNTQSEKNVVENQGVEKSLGLSDSKAKQREPSFYALKLTSMPVGAEVRDTGSNVVVGITPFTMNIPHDKRRSVFAFQKAGFLAVTKKFIHKGTASLNATLNVELKPIPPLPSKTKSPKAKQRPTQSFVAKANTRTRNKPTTSPKRQKQSTAATTMVANKTKTKPNKKQQAKPESKKAPKVQPTIIDPFAEE